MLTAKQQRVYLFIRDYINRHDIAPTQQEIADGVGIQSRGLVHRYISAIVKAGFISTLPGCKRNLVINSDCHLRYSRLPIIGRIAAGRPIEVVEDNKVLDLAAALLGPKRFVLEVKGDSMIGDNICDGDYIICERRDEVLDGDIVVAEIDGRDTTLKRLYHHGEDDVMLTPSNPALKPSVYSTSRVAFKGVYLGLIRLSNTDTAISTMVPTPQTSV